MDGSRTVPSEQNRPSKWVEHDGSSREENLENLRKTKLESRAFLSPAFLNLSARLWPSFRASAGSSKSLQRIAVQSKVLILNLLLL